MSNFVRRLQRMGAGGSIVVDPDPDPPFEGVRMYLSPASGNYATGNTFQMEVRIDTGDVEVNTYAARINYPQSLLQVDSVSVAGSPFPMTMVQEGGGGLIRFSAGIMGAGLHTSGDQLVGTVNFTAISGGSAGLTYDTVASGVARASDSTNAAEQYDGASYTIT